MKSFTTFGLALLFAVASLCLVGCGNKSGGSDSAKSGGSSGKASDLIGQWVWVSGKNPPPKNTSGTMEFLSDGSGVISGTAITWKVENKRLMLTFGTEAEIGSYNLSGDELSLLDDDGNVDDVFVRKEKLTEYKKKMVEKNTSHFTDARNGQKYRAVKIGKKTWMAQNLNYKTGNSSCYGDDDSNCEKYGRLYDWETARNVCPSGWHLPEWTEWNELIEATGGETAGRTLRSASGWEEDGNGTDDYGFSILPGGQRSTKGIFSSIGKFGFLWSATDLSIRLMSDTKPFAYTANIDLNKWNVRRDTDEKSNMANVRCVQD